MRLSVALCVAVCCGPARADELLTLRENYRPGYQYHVSSRVELSGTLTLPPEKDKTPRPLAMHALFAAREIRVGSIKTEQRKTVECLVREVAPSHL